MKIAGILLLAFILIFVCVDFSEAGAYKSNGIGTKSLLRGGGIAAVDDYSAIYWNPAGLSAVESQEIAVEPHYLYLEQSDSNSVKNYDLVNYNALQGDTFFRIYNTPGLAVEPAQFNQTMSIYSDVSPTTSIGGALQLVKGFNLGFGTYTPAGLSTKWEDVTRDLVNNALIEADYMASIKISAYNVSLAKEINSFLSLGAGLNYIYGETDVEAGKRYTSSAAPALNYSFDYKEEGDGGSFEGIFGIIIKPLSVLKIGAVYRSGASLDMEGYSYYKHTALGVNEASYYDQEYEFPNSWGAGISYEPISKVVLLFDWERAGWHKVKRKLDYELQGGAMLTDTDLELNWNDSNQFRLGGEYKWTDKLSLYSSVCWDQTPLSEETVSMTNVIDMDKTNLYLGLGYKTGKMQFTGGYLYCFGDDTIAGVDYELDIHNFMISGKYCF
ncbi:MAG: outer membrane protein transport protein [Candidatus Omnitrophota bacterium]